MKRLRDRKIDFRCAGALYNALEQEAVATGMPNVSAMVRKILVDHAVERIVASSDLRRQAA